MYPVKRVLKGSLPGYFYSLSTIKLLAYQISLPSAAPHPMPHFPRISTLASKNHNSTNMASIDLALADLNAQLVPNIRATARKFQLIESTLRRRWNGQTTSR